MARRVPTGGRAARHRKEQPVRFPLSLTTSMRATSAKNKIRRVPRLPLVLMLERCTPATSLARLRPHREYSSTIKEKLTVEECLDSVDECGAPFVSICGGEPMIYPRPWPAGAAAS